MSYKRGNFYKGYEKGIELEYDKSTDTVKVSWTYYDKAYLGRKGKRRRQCNAYRTREEAEAELLAIAKREQRKSIERAEELKQKGGKPSSQTSAKENGVSMNTTDTLIQGNTVK